MGVGGRLAESVAILLLAPLAGLLLIYLRVSLPQLPRLKRWSQRPLGASLLLLLGGLSAFSLYEAKPKGVPSLVWVLSWPSLWFPLVVALLSVSVVLLATLAALSWAATWLLGPTVRRLRRERPRSPAFRNEQELIEQMYRDLELGRKARTRGEH